MSSNGIVKMALSSLGKGFDLCSDFRLKYCKGDGRLIVLNESYTRELTVPGFGLFGDVSIDIKCDKGDRTRYQSDILNFNQMSEFFNQKCSVPGKIPSGLFNSMFGFDSGSWATDAGKTKHLALDGYFIELFNVHVDRYPLILADHVRNAVPSTWDPLGLARFIEKYGTHIIVGLGIGGQDVILVKQDKSSKIEPSDLKKHLDNLGDQSFTGACVFSAKTKQTNHKVPEAFHVFDAHTNPLNSFPLIMAKDGISVICSKRGGDSSANSHYEWLPTVPSIPDVIRFNFIPITSLLMGVPGKGFLSHAINLYLRYKPPLEDLKYFLDFQAHKIWAPFHNGPPMGPIKNKVYQTPAMQINLMGPKLYVNSTQVVTGNTPVTGMRLHLESLKHSRLSIHLQHLVSPPTLLQDKIHSTPLLWQGSDQVEDNHLYIEARKLCHICTAPVKFNPQWLHLGKDAVSVFIVTGAQLMVKKHEELKNTQVLHLRLAYSMVTNCYIVQSNWTSSNLDQHSMKSGFFSSIGSSTLYTNLEKDKSLPVNVDSGIYPTGPPMPMQSNKLLKYIELSQVCKGPSDSPGHWLVTGAKLDLEKGKICLRVKFSLLNIC